MVVALILGMNNHLTIGAKTMYDPFDLDLIPKDTLVMEIRDLEYINNLPEYPNLQKQDVMEIVRYRNWIIDGNFV